METNRIVDTVLGLPLFVAMVAGYFFGPFIVPGTGSRLLFLGLVLSVPWSIMSAFAEGTRARLASAPFAAGAYGAFAWGMSSGNLGTGRWAGIGLFVLAIVVSIAVSVSR